MKDDRTDNNPNTNNQTTGPDDLREQRREWRHEMHERRRRDPLRGLFWGLLLILVGILFFINQQGTSWDILWKYLLIGLGAIFIIDGLAHYWGPAYHYGGFGRFIPGVVLLFVGLAFLFDFSQWWPVILIALGVIILLSFTFRRR